MCWLLVLKVLITQPIVLLQVFILSIMYLHITVSNVTKKQLEKEVFFNMFFLSITKELIQHAQSVHYVVTHTCENCDYKATTKAILLHHVHFTHNEVKHGSSFIVTAHIMVVVILVIFQSSVD